MLKRVDWLRDVAHAVSVDRRGIKWYDDLVLKKQISFDSLRDERYYEEIQIDIANILYRFFYTIGEPILSGTLNSLATNFGNKDLTDILHSNNFGQGRIDNGWVFNGRSDSLREGVKVKKFGIEVCVPVSQLPTWDENKEPNVGSSIRVLLPSASFGRSPGFYYAHSDLALDYEIPISRIYFNVNPTYAGPLVKFLTTRLNEELIPFDFKICKNVRDYYRSDISVLYFERTSVDKIAGVIKNDLSVLVTKGWFRKKRPAMTMSINEGIGIADSPANGDSFGQHRCKLIAAGILESVKDPGRERTDSIVESFKESGIDPASPYLNDFRDDVYESAFRYEV